MFGTLKRQRGFTYTIVKGKDNVQAEIAMEFITYNPGRSVSILEIDELIKMLKDKHMPAFINKIRCILSLFKELYFSDLKIIQACKAEISLN